MRRPSERFQPNLERPKLLTGGGTTTCGRGPSTDSTSVGKERSVIYRVFLNDEEYVVIDADSPEEAILKLRDAGLEPVKAVPFVTHARQSKG